MRGEGGFGRVRGMSARDIHWKLLFATTLSRRNQIARGRKNYGAQMLGPVFVRLGAEFFPALPLGRRFAVANLPGGRRLGRFIRGGGDRESARQCLGEAQQRPGQLAGWLSSAQYSFFRGRQLPGVRKSV